MSARPDEPLRNQLRIWKSLGFEFLEAYEVAESEAGMGDDPAGLAGNSILGGPDLAPAEREEALARIAAEVGECVACRLCNSRTNTVPGEGSAMAGLMFVGEGPGATEDRMGRPFVGRAGELLDKMIDAMQFRREDVYIANVVKCRPPNNRQPEPDEMATCLPFLHRQIEIIRPEVIVTLGKTALSGLMPEMRQRSMSAARGNWLDYHGVPVMPTFHPAYLLRSPQQKRVVWEDLQMVMRVFGKAPRGRSSGE